MVMSWVVVVDVMMGKLIMMQGGMAKLVREMFKFKSVKRVVVVDVMMGKIMMNIMELML